MKNLFVTLSLLFAITSSSFAQKVDQDQSQVNFKIGSVLWSKVKGTITNMKGKVNFNESSLNKSSFNISIDVSTINTENEKRDAHLKTVDFFDVEKYPTINFQSTSVFKTENGYVTKGKLTIKDVTKDISIPFITTKNENSTILSGEFEINRLDYNIGVDQSTILVDKKVMINITCVLK